MPTRRTLPRNAHGRLFMQAIFQVGNNEVHTVNVYSSMVPSGKHIVKVDGKEVINKTQPIIWFSEEMQFEIGD